VCPVLHYDDFTNDIVYTNLYFDIKTLPQELIPYASLLNAMLGKLGTENYTFGELDNELNIHTGGFSTFTSTFLRIKEMTIFFPSSRLLQKQ
jgi:presequence protease